MELFFSKFRCPVVELGLNEVWIFNFSVSYNRAFEMELLFSTFRYFVVELG